MAREYMALKPYRPSTGSEGVWFIEQWCCDCKAYNICSILSKSFYANVDQWKYDGEGDPMCTSFHNVDWPKKKRQQKVSKRQLKLPMIGE